MTTTAHHIAFTICRRMGMTPAASRESAATNERTESETRERPPPAPPGPAGGVPALRGGEPPRRSDHFASLKAQRLPPWVMPAWLFATSPPQSGTAPPQPETTATHCSPSCSQVMGEPVMPEPVLYFHSSLPVFASQAFR